MDRVPSLLPPLPPPARATLLGFVAGLRSQVPMALLAIETHRGGFDPGAGRLARRFGSNEGVLGTAVAFAGEVVADKLPATPPRTTTGPFLQRLATGATVGAAVHYDAGRPRLLGAVLGAAGAGAGAWAGSRARILAAERTTLPGPLLGAIEDLVAIGLAVLVLEAGRDHG
ncbi:MAG TPA: DUF4126 domain-containing protein [Actinomycetota bacterium]|nr:DUF4126 domain-containing protein [Actinomycetota bacterium]